jgi:hypothetical protein
MVWTDLFQVRNFEVCDSGTWKIVDPMNAKSYISSWRKEWERTGGKPNIRIRPQNKINGRNRTSKVGRRL